MTWTIYPIEQFAHFSHAWDDLVRARPGAPFLTSAFLGPALDVFGVGTERLCLYDDAGTIVAGAIVQKARMGMWQTFQPSQLPLGAWISNGSLDLPSAAAELLGRLPGISLGIGITQLDPRFETRPANNKKLQTQDYIQTAWIDVATNFDAYWESRGKNLKQNMRKQRRKLEADGIEPKCECLSAASDVAEAIKEYGMLETAGWKGVDGTAIHPDNPQGRFYRAMLENFCSAGRGRIYRYCFGDKVVAMDLCIHDNRAIVILKTAYDESYKTVSPSTLMRQEEFRQIFEETGFERIEFYGKVMDWHTRWTEQDRTVYHATAFRWAWLKQLRTHLSSMAAKPTPEQANVEGG